MSRLVPSRTSGRNVSHPVGTLGLVLGLLVGLGAVVGSPGQAAVPAAPAAVGDEVVAWVEVEDGVISGGPGLNSGDHGNFSGTGSYTFRETGMTSTMTVTAPAAGVYPVHVRYAAGPLGADENVTRSMGLLTNGGARQLMSLPMTSFENWEAWRFVTYDVTLNQGENTVAIQCDRSTDFCRLNFDAIQVGGSAPDPCAATPPAAGSTSLFDGTFASFDGWRKAGAGGFGRQTDCTIRTFRGRGATWLTQSQAAPYTLELDWRHAASNDDSSVYVASSSRAGADPVNGYQVRIGTDTGAIMPTGGTLQAADATAVAGAVSPIGEWNTYRIEVTTSRLRVFLNGTLINSTTRPAGASPNGFIGLENRSGADEVDFRSIELRPDVDLGELAGPFSRARLADGTTVNPGGESTLANLVAEAQRWATRGSAAGSAQIALVNPAALGADLLGSPGGFPAVVTHQQVGAVLPSADTLVNLRLTGAQLKTVLEQQWQRTAGGAVPARPFVRLGASTAFTYTYDPTRPEGSRITGMWLNGTAISSASSYSVTVSSSLAAGGDNFRELANGTARQDTGIVGRSALVDYLAAFADTAAGDNPLGPQPTQRAVGVAFPGGASSSYAAGSALDVDLTSWSYSTAADPRDATVDVTVGGRPLGAYPVDNSLGSDPFDEHGKVAVRAILPADLPTGAAVVKIVGSTTGTVVQLPITVTPAPTPTPTPSPPAGTPVPTGTPAPSTVVAPPAKATPTITLKVRPRRLEAGTTAKLAIVVTAQGVTPTGKVSVKIGKKRYTAKLKSGRATIKLARFAKPGKVTVLVTYRGDVRTSPVSMTTKVRVLARR